MLFPRGLGLEGVHAEPAYSTDVPGEIDLNVEMLGRTFRPVVIFTRALPARRRPGGLDRTADFWLLAEGNPSTSRIRVTERLRA